MTPVLDSGAQLALDRIFKPPAKVKVETEQFAKQPVQLPKVQGSIISRLRSLSPLQATSGKVTALQPPERKIVEVKKSTFYEEEPNPFKAIVRLLNPQDPLTKQLQSTFQEAGKESPLGKALTKPINTPEVLKPLLRGKETTTATEIIDELAMVPMVGEFGGLPVKGKMPRVKPKKPKGVTKASQKELAQTKGAEVEALEDISRMTNIAEDDVDLVKMLDGELSKVQKELDARSAPFHGGIKNPFFKGRSTPELDKMAEVYNKFKASVTGEKFVTTEELLTGKVPPIKGEPVDELAIKLQAQLTRELGTQPENIKAAMKAEQLISEKPPIKPPEPPVVGKAAMEGGDAYAKLVEALTPTKKTLGQKIETVRNKFLGEFYDRLDIFRGLENKTGIPAHKMAQVVSGASGYGEDIIRTQVNPILAKLSEREIAGLEQLMVLRRSQDILARYGTSKLPGGLSGLSEIEAAEATLKSKLGDKIFAKVEQAAAGLWRVNDEYVLKPFLNEGIISADSYRNLKAANPHYIDFHREDFSIVDRIDNLLRRPEASVSRTGIERMGELGSIRKLDNPLARSLAQIVKVQNIIARNKAARTIVAALEVAEKNSGQKLVKYLSLGEVAEHSINRDSISFFYNGVKNTVEVPREFAVAAKNMDAQFGNAVTNLINTLNAPLKGGATTYNPAFLVVNPIRDAISAWFREKMVPFSPSYVRGWIAAIAKNSDFSDAARSGVLISGIVETQRSTAGLARAASRGALRVHNPGDAVLIIPRLIESMNIAGERATRIGTYLKLRGQGIDTLSAAVRARDVTVDFSKSGNTMRLINQIIPFSNAGVQGAANTLRVMKNKPGWAITASIPLGIASIVGWVNNQRYETGKEIPDYEYRYNWVYQIGEGEDVKGKFPIYVKIPKGPMGAVLTAPVELLLRLAWKNNDRSVTEELLNTAGGMFTALSPIEPTLSGIMPAPLSAVTGIVTNKDLFRDMPIVPQGEQQRLPEQQFGETTSNVAIMLGQQFKVSPRLIDYAISDYLAGAGQSVNWVSSMGLEALGFTPEMYNEAARKPSAPTQELSKIPVVSRFMGTKATASQTRQWEKFDDAVKETKRNIYNIPDMNRFGIPFGSVGDSINNIELTVEQRVQYQLVTGQLVKNAVDALITTAKYQTLSNDNKKKAIEVAMSAAREQARAIILQQMGVTTAKKRGTSGLTVNRPSTGQKLKPSALLGTMR